MPTQIIFTRAIPHARDASGQPFVPMGMQQAVLFSNLTRFKTGSFAGASSTAMTSK